MNEAIKEELIKLVRGKNSKKLKVFLDSLDLTESNIDLMSIEAENGYSLLHLAAFKKFSNDSEKLILAKIQNACPDPAPLLEYVNRQTANEDGFTALHLAAFHGNFFCIKFLIKEGANVQIRSK